MAATFTEISLEDMETFLKRAFRALKPKKGTERGEIYFDLSLSPNVVVRVWTSVKPRSGMGAGVGEDAIRVQLIYVHLKRPLLTGKAPIVKRTQNWRSNLQERVEDMIETYEDKDEYWEERAGGKPRENDEAKSEDIEERQLREEQLQEKRMQEATPPPQTSRGDLLYGRFTRYRGDYAIRVEGEVHPGDRVLTSRADGRKVTMVIREILWKGRDQTTGAFISLCSFVQGSRSAAQDQEPDHDFTDETPS
jgi:hypothetical protein